MQHGRARRVPHAVGMRTSELGPDPQAVSVALHRLRQRFGVQLRANAVATLAREAAVDAELRELIGAIGR